MKSSTTFGEVLAKHRERLGERVSLEEIFLLHDAAEGSEALSDDERDRLLDRVAADPEAARKLKRLMRFFDESHGVVDDGVEERWARFQAQLPSASRGELPPPYKLTGVLRWQQAARLAAALLLCASLAFWAGRSGSTGDASRDPGVQLNTYVVEISTSGQRSRGGMQVTWPVAAESMLLAISAPEIESTGPFELVVLDSSGKALTERSGLRPDSAGLFLATVSRELLPPGAYEVQLRNDVREILSFFDLEIYADQ